MTVRPSSRWSDGGQPSSLCAFLILALAVAVVAGGDNSLLRASLPSTSMFSLSTHRDPKLLGPDAPTYFQHEAAIAAISIFFFRTTVCFQTGSRQSEQPKSKLSFTLVLQWVFAFILAVMAYLKLPYERITAMELFSYAVPFILSLSPGGDESSARMRRTPEKSSSRGVDKLRKLVLIVASGAASLLMVHPTTLHYLCRVFSLLTPRSVVQALEYLLPITEMTSAYDIMLQFTAPKVLRKQLAHLFFVTFHIQVGMGYLGIDFLRQEQDRRNQLVRMDIMTVSSLKDEKQTDDDSSKNNGSASNKKSVEEKNRSAVLERSKRFQRSAGPFILFTALPYMFQIILYGNINKFAFMCVQDDLHRTVRLNQVFDNDNHLIAMANDSPTSPEAYATSMNTVVATAYEIFNRKLFSLPKVLLLPGVMSRQPMLVAQVFPFIFLSDWAKASVVSYMTTTIENLQKEIQDLNAIRSRVESFDIKNAELLQRSGKGATRFTQRRWEDLTVKVQARLVVSDLLQRSKGFFSFIQRNFVFSVLIDCALANLIAIGKIVSADTFVFSRAIEDAVDMMLMRSRGEAELARMMTEIDKLENLATIWSNSKHRNVLHCTLSPPHRKNVVLRNLVYSRGTAHVRADHIEVPPGVYALTGSNGSGKSTLFRVLMSCNTNEKSIDLPESINLLTPMEPLTEEDDILRETACEVSADETDDDSEDTEMEVGVDGEVAKVSSVAPDSRPTPKLSISMPSSQVVEISQNFYWPLYSRPIDWIFQEDTLDSYSADELHDRTRKVAEELLELEFFKTIGVETVDEEEGDSAEEDMIHHIISQLLEEKEDWFGDLSGGQKSKVELVRKVFLHDHCPDVLLVDETMAPLDPASKSLVMAKLKSFCSESIVIVIYHTDVGQGKEVEGKAIECVPSNNFFDKNIHLEMGAIHIRETC